MFDFAKTNPGMLLLGIAALLGALSLIYEKGFKPAVVLLKRVAKVHDTIDRAWPTLLDIADNLKPNGGFSLRDAIDRIEYNVVLQAQRINAMVQISLIATYECDAEGEYVFVNRAWCEITGMYPNDALGNGWVNAIHPDDRLVVTKEWADALKFERDFDMEFMFRTGKKVHAHATPLRKGGKVIGFVGTAVLLPETPQQ